MKKTTLRQAALKLALLAFVLLSPLGLRAQTLFSEDFEGGSMPIGWTTDGNGTWSVTTGDYSTSTGAGNGTYNAKITHGTTGNATKLITPEIDLSGTTSAVLSYMHVQRSWQGDIDELRVYYRASSSDSWTLLDGQVYTNAVSSWTTEEDIVLPNLSSTYQIAFEFTDKWGYGVGIDYVQIVPGATCPKPGTPTATLTPGNGSIATLNWTENGTATSWELWYGTDENFTDGTYTVLTTGFTYNIENEVTTVTANLTGLTAETQYYAKVKANCGGGDESAWSSESGISFTPTNAFSLTVNDGTTTNNYVPVFGYWADATQRSEFIIPSSQLGALNGATLTSMKFYPNYNFTSTGSFQVYLKEVDEGSFSGTNYYTDNEASVVYTGTIEVSSTNGLVITFNGDGYEYNGGNLLVGFYKASGGNYYSESSCPFYGVSATGASISHYSSYSVSQRDFLPKTTFTYLPNPTPKPRNLAYSSVSSSGATLTWEAPANVIPTGYEYQYKTSTAEWPTDWTSNGTNLSVTLSLSASTTYDFRVRATYSEGESDPVEIQFTTLDNCAFPTNLTASTTPGQGTKATLTWVKGYDETQWVLQYATNNAFTEGLVEVTTGFTTEGTTVTYNATGLTPETHYYARVKANCDGPTSSWSNVADFTPTNYIDYTFGETPYSTVSSVPFYGNYANYGTLSQFIIPAAQLADVAGGTIRRLTFYSSNASASWGDAEFSVYVKEVEASSFASSDAAGLEDWSSMTNVYNGSLSISGNQMVIEFENNFTYNGGNLMIGFNETTTGTSASTYWYYVSGSSNSTLYAYTYNSNYGASYSRGSYLPKVTFNYQPTSTPRPIITEPVETTDVTATIAWTKPSDNVTGYKYQYKLASATEWPTAWIELDANAVSVTVPNLTPNTSYDFQIKAVYAEGESVASSTSFATTCPAATAVPYTYDFETAPKFNCWTVISGNITRMSGSTHASSSYRLDFRGTNSNMIALPAFAEATNTLRIEFWTRPESSTAPSTTNNYSGKFAVGYMTNIEDASTFVAIETYNATDWAESLTYTKKVVDFDVTGVPANAIIAMRQFDCATNYYWYVDDVKVKVIPTCEDVDNVTASNVTNHSATIAWTADATQSAWQIAYKAGANFNPNNADELATATVVDDVTSNPYLFDKNLAAETTYYMYVRGNCGDVDGLGDWSDSYATFTTLAATPAPSNFVASNPASAKVDLVWNAGGGDFEDSWDLYYLPSDDAPTAPTEETPAIKTVTTLPTTENPYTLDDLTEESRYYIWVRANHTINSVTTHSAWVALTGDYFTTLAACSAQDPVVNNITHQSATVNWDGESQDGFTVKYRTSAGVSDNSLFSEDFEDETTFANWTFTSMNTANDIASGKAGRLADAKHNGDYGFRFSSYNEKTEGTYDQYLVSPELNVTGVLNFFYKKYNNNPETLQVGYSTTTNDVATAFTWFDLDLTTSWQQSEDITLPDDVKYIAFHYYADYQYYVYLDDINIWEPTPAGAWQTKAATDNTATITSLTAETKYDVKVVPNCDETQESTIVTFTTKSLFEKVIEANKWYAIASPMHNDGYNETLVGVIGLTTTGTDFAYDLYGYNEGDGTWEKPTTSLNCGKGYIYRRSEGTTLQFVGDANTGSVSVSLTSSCSDIDLKGFNLIGNPYPHAVAISQPYYTLNPNGTWTAHTSNNTIGVAEAFLVYSTYSSNTYYFSDVTPSTNTASASLAFTVSNEEYSDVAYAMLDNGEGLRKIGHLNSEAPMLSIPVEGSRYAIANLGSDCQSFNLVFRGVNGTYTIKQSSNQAIAYCHLIDRVAGKDIDMLRQNYTFSSNGFDADRFMVKLSPDAQENANGNFAYWNGNNWMVEGNGTLQVFDALGRQLFSQEISNSNFEIQNSLFPAAGVYVLRMGEKTQKIVVR